MYLPGANVRCRLSERSLEDTAHLEGVGTDLSDVVEQGPDGGEREHGGEEEHVAELQEHLQVVVQGTLGQSRVIINTLLYQQNASTCVRCSDKCRKARYVKHCMWV